MKTRTEIINWLAARQGYASYLEIGVGDGAHFRAVRCVDKESVDPAESENAGAVPTHRMTSDEFFARNTRQFDLVFIDGLHHAEVVYRDLCNALRVLTPSGMVVCHDLNPANEEMQRVPRAVQAWTGDCWKAWVRLRIEQPELPMVVSEADFGVGVVFPKGRAREAVLEIGIDELDWNRFALHRREWLNLVAPAELPSALFPWPRPPGASDTLALVTLWRGEWTSVQADLLAWYREESIPDGTRAVWMAPEGSEAEARLEAACLALEASGCAWSVELLVTPNVEVTSNELKHHLVAALYSEAVRDLLSDLVLFVEDDMLPPRGALGGLLAVFRGLPANAASMMGIYRSRVRTDAICAGHWHGDYLAWPPDSEAGAVEIGWGGGGFTLYRGECLHRFLPLIAETERSIRGWDITLSERLRNSGRRMFAHCGLRIMHRFVSA